MADLKFGWLSPVIGTPESGHVPIVMYQAEHILPTAFQYFDSVWLADHFYGFERRTDPFLESWTTMTWLATRFPQLCHHVLPESLGAHPPAGRGHPDLPPDVDGNGSQLCGKVLYDQPCLCAAAAGATAADPSRWYG